MAGRVTHGGARATTADVPPEWWERAGEWGRRWMQAHPRFASTVRRASIVGMWVAPLVLVAVLVWRPELRPGVRIWAWCYFMLAGWFLLARTRTVSWRLVASVFAVSLPWSTAIGTVTGRLASSVGSVSGSGASTAIAGLGEESLKVLPVVMLAVVAPGRVRRFAAVDWLLLGFAAGLGFQVFEEWLRGPPTRCGPDRRWGN